MGKVWNAFKRLLKVVVSSFLMIFKKELTSEQWTGFMQFIKFCLVGLLNTLISFGIYYILILINPTLYLVGNAIGFIASVANAYYWNSRFVFQKQNDKAKTIVKTYLVYSTNLIIRTGLLYLLVDLFYVSEFIAPMFNLIITIPLNFLLNKFWVMKG